MFERFYLTQLGERVNVTVGRGIFESRLQKRLAGYPATLVAVDAGVWEHHQLTIQRAVDASPNATICVVDAGETSKSRDWKSKIEDRAFEAGLARDGCIVAIGGGVVGDLAGFVAATYMRGIAFIQVPTTIVAMVDSAVGGKTGIDVPQGKNLVGAFKHPTEIITDLNFLLSLPQDIYRDGYAEIIKHAAIRDAEMFCELEEQSTLLIDRDPQALEALVIRNQGIKIDIVEQDTQEVGLRKLLNFGHTLGHAIELLADYQLSHGQCVVEGMILESQLGEALGITSAGVSERITNLVKKLGFLQIDNVKKYAIDTIVEATHLDKKVASGQVHYVLLDTIGRCAFLESGCSVAVSDAEVHQVIQRYRSGLE